VIVTGADGYRVALRWRSWIPASPIESASWPTDVTARRSRRTLRHSK
jgi:hypothetical protein